MLLTSAILLLLEHAFASPIEAQPLQKRQCPPIHVFGARETTVPPGYGSSGTVVNAILAAHSGATSEAISYPACGGQSSCGGVSYANSVLQGVSAAASAVNSFNSQCPNTILVLVGYSQVRRNAAASSTLQSVKARANELPGWSNIRRRVLRRGRLQ